MNMSDGSIKLTVYFSTYNQEEYVAQALDSMVMQKTNFRYKILAADDCSTDRTQEIILTYQNKYPEMIETFFTPVNLGGCQKLVDCINNGLLEGDYIALLEGDDYWLNENRLQILVDFLEANPQYSRVSHKRQVINEKGEKLRYDTKKNVLEKPFYIEDFLAGKLYSDFGSVFRNYYKQAGDKYNSLLLASRNVCDFQDMFITQDFGPVYVLDQCLSVYRYRSSQGATNYNSITTQQMRCKENIRLAEAVESFYNGKYDLTPMIRFNQRRLIEEAVKTRNSRELEETRNYIGNELYKSLIPEIMYKYMRADKKEELDFIKAHFTKQELRTVNTAELKYILKRLKNKLSGHVENEKLRGTVNG